MWFAPALFLAISIKDLQISYLYASSESLELSDIFIYWFSDQSDTYTLGHVKALLRMQSAFFSLLLCMAFSVLAYTDNSLHKKIRQASERSANA
jgi:hypothetical protein